MGLFLKQQGEGYSLGVWRVEEGLDELLALLPDPCIYQQQLDLIRSSSRKLEWLAVRVLLSVMTDEPAQISYYPSGRPYLAGMSRLISISHTRGYVAVLLSDTLRPGIDIEQYGTRIRKISNRFIHTQEVVNLYQDTDIWGLLLHWSAKETLFKCLDEEGVDFAEHLRISPFQIMQQGQFDAVEYRTQEQFRFTVHYHIFPDFVMTWSFFKAID